MFFGNYRPETFGWTKTDPRVPFVYRGVQFPAGVNAAPGVATIFTRALDVLVPHIPGGLFAGQCWGADNADRVSDSFHEYGLAIDVNAPENPQAARMPVSGGEWELPSNTAALMRPLGIEWGGSWSLSTPPDPMHLELALSPEEAKTMAASLIHTMWTPPAAGVLGVYGKWWTGRAGSRTMQQWCDGIDVQQLQKVLNQWYPSLTPQLVVDGYYGPATTATVKYNQARAHITVDGIAGPVTLRELGF